MLLEALLYEVKHFPSAKSIDVLETEVSLMAACVSPKFQFALVHQ